MKKTLLTLWLLYSSISTSINVLAANDVTVDSATDVAATDSVAKNNLSLKLDGSFEFKAIGSIRGPQKKISQNQKGFGFDTQGFMRGTISNKTEDDLEYGAKIILRTQARARGTASVNGSHLFLESKDYGKLQLGSQYDASTLMQQSADDLSKGSGFGIFGNAELKPEDLYGTDVMNSNDFFLCNWTDGDDAPNKESSRKISYFTPEFHGLQIGVSYIPDTTNTGGAKMIKSKGPTKDVKLENGDTYKAALGAKNAISWGVSFKHVIEDGLDFEVEVDGEYGKALQKRGKITFSDTTKPADTKDNVSLTGDEKLANLRSWNVGGQLNFGGGWSIAGSYSDLGKSYTSKAADGNRRSAKYYTAGISYTQGPVGASIGYLRTDAKKNIMDGVVIGTNYTLFPGVTTYATIGFIKSKSTPMWPADKLLQKKKKYNHTVCTAGVKISI